MRYRKIDSYGDYVFGTKFDFLVDSPEAVAQAVKTRLALWYGEWFLDTTDGTRWNENVLGHRMASKNYDAEIRRRILGTPNVSEISEYSSEYNGDSRSLSVAANITTAYGVTRLITTLSV